MSDEPTNSPFPPSFDFAHNPTWRIFRILAEFVDGFTFLANISHSVTIFGSARLPEDSPYYQLARGLGQRLAERGYTVVTGGGPGIMQAANQGACEGGGNSVGLNIQLPREQRINPYVRESISFHFFFSRKVMLDFSAEAYIFFPGGFGTLDEFFELLTLTQTGKTDSQPVILVGKAFWEPLINWMRSELLERLHTIEADDLRVWTLTDDMDEVLRLVEEGVREQTQRRVAATGQSNPSPDEKLRQATRPMTGREQ